jgi:XRE family transcriptional regulator, aerobic/anaerobic benzoate catabolism transcriptional regulator
VRDHPLLSHLGATVRSLRKARGWTRRELAGHSGISERFLADVEAGAANPSLLKLAAIAQALEVGLIALVGGGPLGPSGRARQHVALLGLRGAGKSTVGPRLAERLGLRFVELDARIEAATGLQIGDMFLLHGEDYYRRAERSALEQLLAEREPAVLAVGGGVVVEPTSFALLRALARSVWLRAAPEDHWQRVLAQGDTRPMANNDRAFADLRRILADREPYYRQAELTVETSGRSVESVVEELAARLRE